uniref:Tyrosine-protein kinase receptor n=1 Tax=Strongyloides stercoralis TaxID=6248 RepID=A0A913IBI9_STRER
MITFKFLIIFFIFPFINGFKSSDTVNTLSGVIEYFEDWGYTDIRKGAHTFWWLFAAKNNTLNENRPLILWLQGGPGASSTGFGNLEELGPKDLNGNDRNYTWLQISDLIFVDNPVGSGFSYVDSDDKFTKNVADIASDLLKWAKDFFNNQHPEYKKRPFYIFCESYGGKMAAEFSRYLFNEIRFSNLDVKFYGVALGDSWISAMDFVNTWPDYLYSLSFLDDRDLAIARKVADKCQKLVDSGKFSDATNCWGDMENTISELTNDVSWYNILKNSGIDDWSRLYNHYVSPLQNDALSDFMNTKGRKKFGIIPTSVQFGGQSGKVFDYQSGDFMKPNYDTVDYLLLNNVNVTVYNGQMDLICDTLGVNKWIDRLTWKGMLNFYSTPKLSYSIRDSQQTAEFGDVNVMKKMIELEDACNNKLSINNNKWKIDVIIECQYNDNCCYSQFFNKNITIYKDVKFNDNVTYKYKENNITTKDFDNKNNILKYRYSLMASTKLIICNDNSIILPPSLFKDEGNCNFEKECLWIFGNEKDGIGDSNFLKILGVRDRQTTHFAYFNGTLNSQNDIGMIISPYFQYTSPKCELRFKYKVIGRIGSSITVTTQQKSLFSENVNTIDNNNIFDDYTYDDDILYSNPIQHKVFHSKSSIRDSWQEGIVEIGGISHPTRVRIECHTNGPTECFVDDIVLYKCDEETFEEGNCESKHTKKYKCKNSFNGHIRNVKCIEYDQICDMSIDCPEGDDEDNILHNCTIVPPGGKCNFEVKNFSINNSIGCDGWIQEFYEDKKLINNSASSYSLVDINGALKLEGDMKRIPFHDHTFNKFNKSGHFLWRTYQNSDSLSKTKSILKSPLFPPMSPLIDDPTSLLYESCRLNFFYCYYGTTVPSLKVYIETNSVTKSTTDIWNALFHREFSSSSSHCLWEKASVKIPRQVKSYRIVFTNSPVLDMVISYALDDISLTPGCFIDTKNEEDDYIPFVYNITTKNDPNNDNIYNNIIIEKNNFKSLTLPMTTEYYIKLCGGSGGKLPFQRYSNNGGCISFYKNYTSNTVLTFIVGEKGNTPCININNTSTNLSPEMISEGKKIACSGNPKIAEELFSNMDENLKRILEIPSTSGGGGTVLLDGNKVFAVAGGGGGIVPEIYANVVLEKDDVIGIDGGVLFDKSKHIKILKSLYYNNWKAGHGGSIFDKINIDCKDKLCPTNNGILNLKNSSGGYCSQGFHWNIVGGFGGGGAACATSGAGGGGYIGGLSGNNTHGSGGLSYILDKKLKFKNDIGINNGDGYVLIYTCKLDCKKPSVCRFVQNYGNDDVKEICQCDNGKEIKEGSNDCSEEILIENNIESIFSNILSTWKYIIFTLIIGILLLFLIIFFLKKYCFVKKRKDNKRVFNGTLNNSQSLDFFVNQLSPIYESIGGLPPAALAAIPQIQRSDLTFKQLIGQGAFGEVYEGILFIGKAEISVAIKTLLPTATQDGIEDFALEGFTMSRFNHPNIVQFFGCILDESPKCLVLELLDGGDLKSFLRDNRPDKKISNNTKLLYKCDEPLIMYDLVYLAYQIAKGCEYLEQNKFIHRDIAARNCLIGGTNRSNRIAKIADFGMARDIYKSDYYRKGGKAMLPVKWMPCEAFLDGIFTSKSDAWAYGILLWEIFSMGYLPYPGRNNQEVMQLVVSGGRLEPPTGTPKKIYNLMLKCWNTYQDDRPTFSEIVYVLEDVLSEQLLKQEPLPPMMHKINEINTYNAPQNFQMSSSIHHENEEDGLLPQSISNMTMSTTSGSINVPYEEKIPIDSVTLNVFPPYQSIKRLPEIITNEQKNSQLSVFYKPGNEKSDEETTLLGYEAGSRKPIIGNDS